ncbi:MAG TPA: hypothetical protein VD707_09670 [Gemmatimonadales bacterium]|nr:hypothetical protein [Gemmatimonadales bacterium]
MRRVWAAVLITAGCAGGDVPLSAVRRPQLNTAFTLRVGQAAVLDEPAVVITFTAVTHDSRCPVDVVCIWSGDGVVRLTLHVGPPGGEGPDVVADLHTNLEPRSTPWGPYYELRLLGLEPEPRMDPPPTEPYRATLVMETR